VATGGENSRILLFLLMLMFIPSAAYRYNSDVITVFRNTPVTIPINPKKQAGHLGLIAMWVVPAVDYLL
jgi:hypothetical protein